jgi:hypothetical protein
MTAKIDSPISHPCATIDGGKSGVEQCTPVSS